MSVQFQNFRAEQCGKYDAKTKTMHWAVVCCGMNIVYCDTEEEALSVVADFHELEEKWRRSQEAKGG